MNFVLFRREFELQSFYSAILIPFHTMDIVWTFCPVADGGLQWPGCWVAGMGLGGGDGDLAAMEPEATEPEVTEVIELG